MNCQQVSSIGYKDSEKVERPRSVAWSPRKNISTWLGGFMQIYFVLTWWPLGKKETNRRTSVHRYLIISGKKQYINWIGSLYSKICFRKLSRGIAKLPLSPIPICTPRWNKCEISFFPFLWSNLNKNTYPLSGRSEYDSRNVKISKNPHLMSILKILGIDRVCLSQTLG